MSVSPSSSGAEPSLLPYIGDYDLQEAIGSGGMSTVYRAVDRRSGAAVALKVILPALSANPEYARRFLEQGQSIAKLNHPHIVRVLEVAQQDSMLFMAMEYVDGVTLREHLDQRLANEELLDLREVVTIARQVAQALHHAHEHGLIHRDVKPDNVLLNVAGNSSAPVHAMLTDFGLAPQIRGGEAITGEVEILGTPAYMAPEQIRGLPLDGRYDIYSLGIMLYEMVTGRPPFPAASINEMLLMQTQGEPLKVQELRPNVPPALVSIILRAMRKNPDDRYETAAEIGRELEALEKSIRQLQAETIRIFPPIPLRRDEIPSGPATVYDLIPALDRPPIPVTLISEGADDVILVLPPQGDPITVTLDKPTLSIGRDPRSDVVLNDPHVSRRHLQVERLPDGRLVITDAGSQNGTYLNEVKLARSTTAVWSDGGSLKVGAYWLLLRLARAPIGVGRRQLTLDAAAPLKAEIGKEANAEISQPQAVVEPGRAVIVRVQVENLTSSENEFSLEVSGLPPTWYTIAPLPLILPAKATGERMITLHPPRVPATTPQQYPYTVHVLTDDPYLKGQLDCSLEVYPYFEFASDTSINDRRLRIQISNQGNTARSYVAEVREPANKLVIAPARTRVTTASGESTDVNMRLRPKQQPWIGQPQSYPLEVFVRGEGLPVQSHELHYTVFPRVPWWALVIIAVMSFSVILFLITNL
ncbi:MAG: protein kinase [Anaerolineae bacterium]|nr:protein kinase [Anaerolineae bacterium]